MKKMIFKFISFFAILTLFTGCGLKSFVFGETPENVKEPTINVVETETKTENNEKVSGLKSVTIQKLSELEKNTSNNRKVQKVTKSGHMFVFEPEKIKSKCSDNKFDTLMSATNLKNVYNTPTNIEVTESNNERKTVITLDTLKKGVIYSVESCINDKGSFDTRVVTKFLDIVN